MIRTTFMAAALAVIAALSATAARAEYPERNITIIVPYPPGSTADLLARELGRQMTIDWGKQVLVENRPGAGGSVGADFVAHAKPDGYTLLLVHQLAADHQSGAVQVAQLPDAARLRADRAPRRQWPPGGGDPGAEPQDIPGSDRAREEKAGLGHRRHLRQRHHRPSGAGADRQVRRRHHDACAVQRWHPEPDGGDVRRGSGHHRRHRSRAAAGPRRPPGGARQHGGTPAAGGAGNPHHRRVGLSGRGHRSLGGPAGAARDVRTTSSTS